MKENRKLTHRLTYEQHVIVAASLHMCRDILFNVLEIIVPAYGVSFPASKLIEKINYSWGILPKIMWLLNNQFIINCTERTHVLYPYEITRTNDVKDAYGIIAVKLAQHSCDSNLERL